MAQAAARADHAATSVLKGLVIAGLVAALHGPVLIQIVLPW
jgi:hypothetical protein